MVPVNLRNIENLMKIGIITQARLSSSRYPNKILSCISGMTLLELHLKRLKESRFANEFIVATAYEEGVEKISHIAEKSGFKTSIYDGDVNNVLARFLKVIKEFNLDIVIRVTSDCPLIDSSLIDEIINDFLQNKVDYLSNTLLDKYPDGQDIEVFSAVALKQSSEYDLKPSDLEHVTLKLKNHNKFQKKEFSGSSLLDNKFNKVRMTVDYEEDLKVIELLVNTLGSKASWLDYSNYYLDNIDHMINRSILRNEGLFKSLKNDKRK